MRHLAVSAALTALLACAALAQPPAIDLRLPSEAAGGGTLAVRLTMPPAQTGPRYPEGAPIIVLAPGGHGPGGLGGGEAYALQGFVSITFVFPGGVTGPFHSDGVYDYRGPGCRQALRDVLLFAGGKKLDELGRSIRQVLPFDVLTEQVGIVALSNGGPIAVATLATHGAVLPFVATFVGWENPTGGQTVAAEAGARSYDCNPAGDGDGNGIPVDDGKNPYLTAYADSTLGMEFMRLAFDPDYAWVASDPAALHPPVQVTGSLFLDGNGNGRLDLAGSGPECFDLDGDGRLGAGEDYRLRPIVSYATGALRAHHSVEVVSHAAAQGVFGTEWPAEVATVEEDEAYWAHRDATRWYAALALARPDLRCLLSFGAADHVQASDEHVHIQQAYDGLRGHGLWCRLNPDEMYVRMVNADPPAPPSDHDANLPVAWPQMGSYTEPYALEMAEATLAAVMEMADRARAGNWEPNLGDLSAAPASRESRTLPALRAAPSPTSGATTVFLELPARATMQLGVYDLSGRLVRQLTRGALDAGERVFSWDGRDEENRAVATGVYWIRASSASGGSVERVILVR